MELFDGNGNKITVGGDLSEQVTPSDTTFFDMEYPGYTNLFNGEYEVGILSGGNVNAASTAARTTGFIDISGGAYVYPEYVYSFAYNPERVSLDPTYMYRALAFYDESKTHLETRDNSTDPRVEGNFEIQAIPEGAKYCRVSWSITYGNSFNDPSRYFVGIASDNSLPVLPWEQYYAPGELKSARLKRENITFTDEPLYRGKTWVLFGDSLTDSYGGHDWQENTSPVGGEGWKDTDEKVPWTGHFWASKIARELGLVLDNRAESGSNINVGSNGNYADVCGVNILDAFLAEIDAGAEVPDYITIGFGSNAIISQLGTAEDTSESTSTVCGAVKYFIEKLREKCPNAVIGFVLPPQSDWGSNSTVKSVSQGRDAIKSVLDLDTYSVPYVDMWKESGITVDMLPDGIHVSSIQANNLYYHAMRRFMLGL